MISWGPGNGHDADDRTAIGTTRHVNCTCVARGFGAGSARLYALN